VKNGSLKTAPGLCLEIRQHSLQVLRGEDGLELPLERLPNGSLAPACKARVISELQSFLKPSSWRSRPRVACAIGARGVSLRRLSLPAANGETMQQLLRLQIEREFPLSPDELAWGWRGTGGSGVSTKQQEILVVAVKKETLGDYIEILNACGLAPAFTLAALARAGLCRRAPRA
jgi:hypothetical protein